MKMIIALLATAFCSQAMAYSTGTFNCKNSDASLPANNFKITDTMVGTVTAPFVEVTRYYRQDPSNANSPMESTTIKGFATVSSIGQTEILLLGQMRMQFDNGVLYGCTAP